MGEKMGQSLRTRMRLTVVILPILFLINMICGCKPDVIEVDIYTSDIQKANIEGVVEVPFSATFRMIGEDKEGIVSKASAVAKKYLGEKTEFKDLKGDFGEILVIKSMVPMGAAEDLQVFLTKSHRPFAITISDSSRIILSKTVYFDKLNDDLHNINFMLWVNLPANRTIFRLIGDLKRSPQVTAIADFLDTKPELILQRTVSRLEAFIVDYRGNEGLVHNELSPTFEMKY